MANVSKSHRCQVTTCAKPSARYAVDRRIPLPAFQQPIRHLQKDPVIGSPTSFEGAPELTWPKPSRPRSPCFPVAMRRLLKPPAAAGSSAMDLQTGTLHPDPRSASSEPAANHRRPAANASTTPSALTSAIPGRSICEAPSSLEDACAKSFRKSDRRIATGVPHWFTTLSQRSDSLGSSAQRESGIPPRWYHSRLRRGLGPVENGALATAQPVTLPSATSISGWTASRCFSARMEDPQAVHSR